MDETAKSTAGIHQEDAICEWKPEPDEKCEACHKIIADLEPPLNEQVLFHSTNYWDSREGYYYCGKCYLEMMNQDASP